MYSKMNTYKIFNILFIIFIQKYIRNSIREPVVQKR
jgi:hypothetical protein